MAPETDQGSLDPRMTGRIGYSKSVEVGSSGPVTSRVTSDVTNDVTRLRALLRGVKEAIADGEYARADRLADQALHASASALRHMIKALEEDES